MLRFVNPSTKDILDRVSRSSISHHEHLGMEACDTYLETDTPKAILRPSGGPLLTEETPSSHSVKAWDKRWLGLTLHNVAMGLVSTILPLTIFPFLNNYLNMEGTQSMSARMLLAIPWMLKPLVEMLIYAMPHVLGRLKRRTIMGIGWVMSGVPLICIHSYAQPDPFFRDRDLVAKALEDMNATELATINMDAPSFGALYVLLMSISTIGYIFADVAADMVMLDISRSIFHVQTTEEDTIFMPVMTKYRYGAMLFSFLYMGFSMSGWNYGGEFDFTFEYTFNMLLLGIVLLALMPFIVLYSLEVSMETVHFALNVSKLWHLLQNTAVTYIIFIRFIGGVLGGITAVAVNPIAYYWATVQPLNDNVVSFVATGVVLLAFGYANKKGWSVNYKIVILGANVIILVLDCGATLFTIWNVVRSMWFWIGLPVMDALPSILDYIIFSVVLKEMAEPGMESLVGAVVTALTVLASSTGLAISKYIDMPFEVSNQDIMTDTFAVRIQATGVFVIAYLFQLGSMCFLFLLPKDSVEAKKWRMEGGESPLKATLMMLTFALCFVLTTAMHILSVNQSTECYNAVGGRGC